MRLRISLALLIALLLVIGLPHVWDLARVAAGGKPLIRALLLRADAGDLALGPDTPAIWALARGRANDLPGPAAGRQPANLVVTRLAVENDLLQAVIRLRQVGTNQRLLGIAEGSHGNYRDAANALTLAELAHPDDPFAHLAVANVLDAQGFRQAAASVWQELDAQRPIALQLQRTGAGLARDGLRDQAEAMLLLAIEVDPTLADPYHTLGGFYWGTDPDKSAQMYRTALVLGGLEPFFAALAEGKLALLENRPQDAVIALQEAVRLDPSHGDAMQTLGSALRQAGRSDEAIAVLQRSVDLNPDSPWPLIQMAQLYLEQFAYDKAVTVLVQSIERRADLPLAFELLGQAYLGEGRPAQAVTALRQAISLNPGNVSSWVRLGDGLQLLDQVSEARAAYQSALELDPTNDYASRQLERLGSSPMDQP